MSINRRQHERSSQPVQVEMFHEAFGRIKVTADNISDGGIFVLMEHHVVPPVGTVVKVKMKRFTGAINEEAVDMIVVHRLGRGLGLKFI